MIECLVECPFDSKAIFADPLELAQCCKCGYTNDAYNCPFVEFIVEQYFKEKFEVYNDRLSF